MPAMVVNDNARELDKHGAFESIASKLAPTVPRECVKNLFLPSGIGYLRRRQWHMRIIPGKPIGLAGFLRHAFAGVGIRAHDRPIRPVGAGLPAMVVNDNARELDKHGAFESIASKPAPTIPPGMREEPFLPSGIGYLRRCRWHMRIIPDKPIGLAGFLRQAFAGVGIRAHDRPVRPVGAGLPAMVVNDNARELDKHGAFESIASNRASTGRSCNSPGNA
ncbi:hypothetical protein AN403_4352 [Pseudomonas fluorescens]|uniref:Uncharacterized protein n=1 Tax=Pseudomonas fluorescens TaxID=294 RepID=A0A0P8X2R5_PSEFL|nr:hypothetical protein AN403_4352 [Pseudomonas fluorescens]